MSDTIGNMLVKIKNAQSAGHENVEVPFSNLGWAVVSLLEKERFLAGAEKKGRKEKRVIEIALRYDGRKPVINVLKRISKPSRRVYIKSAAIFPKKGVVKILSTPSGIMTDKEARKKKIGGEIICELY